MGKKELPRHLRFKNIKELEKRSVCLIPREDSNAAITCHEYDYCKCDIEFLLDKIQTSFKIEEITLAVGNFDYWDIKLLTDTTRTEECQNRFYMEITNFSLNMGESEVKEILNKLFPEVKIRRM